MAVCLGGATLGCYLLTWSGGSLFVMVVVASATASLVFQRLRREATDNLPLILAPAFVLAAAMIWPWVGTRPFFGYDVAALVGGLLLLIAVRAWGSGTASHRHDLAVYLTGLAVSAALCLLVAYIGQGGWSGLVREIGRLWPQQRTVFVREALPLLRSEARYPLPLWNEFVACLFLAILGGVAFLVRPRAVTSAKGALLAVWTGVMIAATFAQVRFTYYLGMNVALLAGFACDQLLRRGGPLARRATGFAILLLVTLPSAARIEAERGSENALSDDWYDALQWLRSNTTEPFDTDEAYYRTDFTISSQRQSPQRLRRPGVVELRLLDHPRGPQGSEHEPEADTGERGRVVPARRESGGGISRPRHAGFALRCRRCVPAGSDFRSTQRSLTALREYRRNRAGRRPTDYCQEIEIGE